MSLSQESLALSSWAVHDWIGETFLSGPGLSPPHNPHLGRVLELPHEAKSQLGITTLEICHFHLVQEPKQLERLRSACVRAGTRLHQLLIDDGDIAHPTDRFAYLEWIGGWIQAASVAGFERVRIIAGKQQATPESVKTSIESFKMLLDLAKSLKVAISTENWHELMEDPETVLQVLAGTNGQLGLVLDFGNYTGPEKYEKLARIAPKATSAHAKCNFERGIPDKDDFRKCLRILEAVDFKGLATLVHPEKGNEWAALEIQRDLALGLS
jgi:sugar phosphate isomerase/epimerase